MSTMDVTAWLDTRADIYLPVDSSALLTEALIDSFTQVCDQIEGGAGDRITVLHVIGENAPQRVDRQWPGDDVDIQLVSRWERTLRRLERLPGAIIGIAQGNCSGPALEILLSADHRIGTLDLSLSLPVSNGQVWPGMAVHRLATQIGVAAARQLVLFGRNTPADVALRIGLLDEITADLTESVMFAGNVVGGLVGSELAIRRRLLLDATTTGFEDSLGAHLAACDRMLRRSQQRG
jgi:isomerase DpgB